jgi:choline kinase
MFISSSENANCLIATKNRSVLGWRVRKINHSGVQRNLWGGGFVHHLDSGDGFTQKCQNSPIKQTL